MTPNVRLAQLYVLRGQIDVLIAMEEGAYSADAPSCPHPEEKRRQTTVMGGESEFLCMACGETVKGMA